MERLGAEILAAIAKKKNVSKEKAAKIIDKCLEQVSVELDVSYNAVYETFYTFSGLASCAAGICEKETVEDCRKHCHCVEYKGKCVPRFIANSPEINADPDKYAGNLSTANLEKLLEYAAYLYYNFEGGGLTDNAFDSLEYQLNKRLKARGRRYEKIGAEPVDKIRVRLPYPMASLEKIKPGMNALLAFLSQAKKHGMVWSDKLDGVSGMVLYKNGKIDGIYTRGNGEIGGDVSYLRNYIKFPKVDKKYLVVRGEFILSKRVWTEKYQGSYANARSFVSAQINSGHISPGLSDISFVAYQIVDHSEKGLPSPGKGLKLLKQMGFKTPMNGIFPKGEDLLAFTIVTLYKERREASQYSIDGLVLSLDVPHTLATLGNPQYSKAFKMTLESQLRETKITNVEWNITRHGRYFPVAIYESVYIDGVRLHRASAHNANHVLDWHLGRGTKIVIARSGDVIPTIKDVSVEQKINPILPDETFDWHWSGKDILLNDIDGNPEVHIKRILHFVSTIQVPQLGEGRVRKLYGAGLTDLKKILTARPKDFKSIKGFGEKLSLQIFDNLHQTMQNTRMDRFFVAITTFKTQIGRTLLKQVLRVYPEIMQASKSEILNHLKKNKIVGIGVKRTETLAEAIPQFRKILFDLNRIDTEFAIKNSEERLRRLETEGYNEKIKGKTFVFTGFLDHPHYELEDYLWDHWANITSTVTGKVDGVIAANLANITGKMMAAHDSGIPVYSIPEFVRTMNIPIKVPEQMELIIPED